jgi:hypothetical protein
MNCVILQPSYIPWRGYFYQIRCADVFVFYDDVQFDKGGWRHRNRISTLQGPHWLTIPVKHKGHLRDNLKLSDVVIDWNQNWITKHWRSICQSYARSPFFLEVSSMLKPFYETHPDKLCEFIIPLTICISEFLGLQTRFMRSSEMNISGGQTERLVNIVNAVGCSRYLSGPSAKSYIDASEFAASGITLEYAHYDFPEYPQLHPPFEPQLSIIDLLFMVGPRAVDYLGNINESPHTV